VTHVEVYQVDSVRAVTRTGSIQILPPVWSDVTLHATLDWSTDGRHIVAATDSQTGFVVLDVAEGGTILTERGVLSPCSAGLPGIRQAPSDILTGNGYIVPPPTASAGPTATSTARLPTTTDTATVTATASATPTDTQLATSTPTPRPSTTPSPLFATSPTWTSTRTPTPTPAPQPLYLPITLRERCPAAKQHVDVALVIDASTSMRDERTAAGRTRLEAALEAARTFAAGLALPADQAAVLGFNSTAWVETGLTGRRADVNSALRRLPSHVRQQTRLDLGVEGAHMELTGPWRLRMNRPVMIVLTDGLANPEPAATAVRRAAEAKADGITIFMIGLGTQGQLDVSELREMASEPGYFNRAPDAEDLAAIYRAIAVELPCPGVRMWGRR